MEIDDLLKQSINVSILAKYKVKIFNNEIKEMTYLELGMFLINNVNSIEKIIISEKK